MNKTMRCHNEQMWRRLYTGAFYTEMLLHTDAFTQNLLRPRRVCTQKLLDRSFLDAVAFAHRRFRHKSFFLERNFYTQIFTESLRSEGWQTLFYTEVHGENFLDTDAFTHKNFYTEAFYMQTLLHRESLIQKLLKCGRFCF